MIFVPNWQYVLWVLLLLDGVTINIYMAVTMLDRKLSENLCAGVLTIIVHHSIAYISKFHMNY